MDTKLPSLGKPLGVHAQTHTHWLFQEGSGQQVALESPSWDSGWPTSVWLVWYPVQGQGFDWSDGSVSPASGVGGDRAVSVTLWYSSRRPRTPENVTLFQGLS